MELLIFVVLLIVFAFILGCCRKTTIHIFDTDMDELRDLLIDNQMFIPTKFFDTYTERLSVLRTEVTEFDYRSFNTTNKRDRKDKYKVTAEELRIRISRLGVEINETINKYR